jgi:hypothetical protein
VSGPIQIEDVKRLDVQPGDRLLVKVPATFTAPEVARLAEVLRSELGDGIKFVIAPAGIDVSVIRPVGEPDGVNT